MDFEMDVLEEMEMNMVIIDAIEFPIRVKRPGENIDLLASAIQPNIDIARRTFIGLGIITPHRNALQQAARESILAKELDSLLPCLSNLDRIELALLRRIPPMECGMLCRILFPGKTLNGWKEDACDRLIPSYRQCPVPFLIRIGAGQSVLYSSKDFNQFKEEV